MKSLLFLGNNTSLATAVGTKYRLISELKANKMMIRINKNPQVFENEYKKFEKYSKAYYIDNP